MKSRLKGNIILFITSIIWGISFVSQSVGMDYIGPNTFMGIRTTMGGLVLIPFIVLTDFGKKKQGTYKKTDLNRSGKVFDRGTKAY